MIKKYVPFLLVISILFSLWTVPVRASSAAFDDSNLYFGVDFDNKDVTDKNIRIWNQLYLLKI